VESASTHIINIVLHTHFKEIFYSIEWQKILQTFLGENTPTVMPSTFTATPISANTASLCNLIASVLFNLSSHDSFNSTIKGLLLKLYFENI
jgi:hypothetical protein